MKKRRGKRNGRSKILFYFPQHVSYYSINFEDWVPSQEMVIKPVLEPGPGLDVHL